MKTLLKVLKWTGLSIVSLIVLAVIYTYGMSYYTLNQSFDIPLVDVVVPTDSASIAEG